MENPSVPSFELHEPPPGLLKMPVNQVKALMDTPDEVAAAIDDLDAAGFRRNDVVVLCGPEGAERLDVSGRRHGLAARVYRVAEQLGDSRGALELSAEHMRSGGFWLLVPAGDADEATTLAEILGRHGAHDMVHYGRYSHGRIGST